MKNLLTALLGIAFIFAGKENRQLAEQRRQIEEKVKLAEAQSGRSSTHVPDVHRAELGKLSGNAGAFARPTTYELSAFYPCQVVCKFPQVNNCHDFGIMCADKSLINDARLWN